MERKMVEQLGGEPLEQINVLPVGKDKFGKEWGLGISRIAFKVSPKGEGDPLIIENIFLEKGGPPRHLHLFQDEWFYVVEGEFVIEIDSKSHQLKPGDSILAPRNIPHVFAFNSGTIGRILIAFMPAGKMESFFREASLVKAMPRQDPQFWQAYDMKLLGPPLI